MQWIMMYQITGKLILYSVDIELIIKTNTIWGFYVYDILYKDSRIHKLYQA